MLEVGKWVEADNGYGVIERLFPEYYQFGDDSLPPRKRVGDTKQNVIVVKRFCSFDFKVYPQTRIVSEILVRAMDNEALGKVRSLLENDKNRKRFEKYRPKTRKTGTDLFFGRVLRGVSSRMAV